MIQFLLINPKSAICIPQSRNPHPATRNPSTKSAQNPSTVLSLTHRRHWRRRALNNKLKEIEFLQFLNS